MGFTPRQQEEFDGLVASLRSQEPEALAHALAAMLVFSFFSQKVKAQTVAEVKENSVIIRRNRRIKTRNNKLARVRELAGKRKFTTAERKELQALHRYFEREIRQAAEE